MTLGRWGFWLGRVSIWDVCYLSRIRIHHLSTSCKCNLCKNEWVQDKYLMECFISFPFSPPSLSGSIDLALLKQLYKVKYIGALKLGETLSERAQFRIWNRYSNWMTIHNLFSVSEERDQLFFSSKVWLRYIKSTRSLIVQWCKIIWWEFYRGPQIWWEWNGIIINGGDPIQKWKCNSGP